MSKLNYTVEVEINEQWVHAQVRTLAEAKALIIAFDTSTENIFDAGIYLNDDATDDAKAEYKAYKTAAHKAVLDYIAMQNSVLDHMLPQCK